MTIAPLSASLIERARAVRIEDETEARGIKLVGRIDRCGPCPQCGGHDRFSINIRKQVFLCRGSASGGVIDLVMHVDGVDFRTAVETLCGERAIENKPRPRIVAPARSDDDAIRERDRAIARRIAGEAVPLIGTPGEAYLAEARKIDVATIKDVLSQRDAIGWHPAVYFSEMGHQLHAQRLGCIVGVMTDAVTGEPTGAISRTYVHDGKKIGPAKTIGIPAGIVRLTPDDEVLGGLHLAEGIESALSGMSEGFRQMWATGSTSLMAKFPVLGGIESLTIFADHDENDAGERAAREAAARWRAVGREVRIIVRNQLGDFNDAIRESET